MSADFPEEDEDYNEEQAALEERLWGHMSDAAMVLVARAVDLWGFPEPGGEWVDVLHSELDSAIRRARRHPEWIPRRRPKRRPISGAIRIQVFERDAYRCQRCGAWENLTVDHIVPFTAGGEDSLANFQTLCKSCNSWKGSKVL